MNMSNKVSEDLETTNDTNSVKTLNSNNNSAPTSTSPNSAVSANSTENHENNNHPGSLLDNVSDNNKFSFGYSFGYDFGMNSPHGHNHSSQHNIHHDDMHHDGYDHGGASSFVDSPASPFHDPSYQKKMDEEILHHQIGQIEQDLNFGNDDDDDDDDDHDDALVDGGALVEKNNKQEDFHSHVLPHQSDMGMFMQSLNMQRDFNQRTMEESQGQVHHYPKSYSAFVSDNSSAGNVNNETENVASPASLSNTSKMSSVGLDQSEDQYSSSSFLSPYSYGSRSPVFTTQTSTPVSTEKNHAGSSSNNSNAIWLSGGAQNSSVGSNMNNQDLHLDKTDESSFEPFRQRSQPSLNNGINNNSNNTNNNSNNNNVSNSRHHHQLQQQHSYPQPLHHHHQIQHQNSVNHFNLTGAISNNVEWDIPSASVSDTNLLFNEVVSDKRVNGNNKSNNGTDPTNGKSHLLHTMGSNLPVGKSTDLSLPSTPKSGVVFNSSNVLPSPSPFSSPIVSKLPYNNNNRPSNNNTPSSMNKSLSKSNLTSYVLHMLDFKIKKCNKRGCKDVVNCPMYHGCYDRRRPLTVNENNELNYASALCKHMRVKDNNNNNGNNNNASNFVQCNCENNNDNEPSHSKMRSHCSYARRCRLGDKCRYAHNNYEIANHPMMYKTKPCLYTLAKNKICPAMGLFCSKYHTEEVKRLKEIPDTIPFAPSAGSNQNEDLLPASNKANNTVGTANSAVTNAAAGTTSSSDTASRSQRRQRQQQQQQSSKQQQQQQQQTVLPIAEDASATANVSGNNKKDSFCVDTFKTEKCHKKQAHTTSLCPFYHDSKDRRRKQLKYISTWCPYVYDRRRKNGDVSACPEGDECMYAHTRYELMFHPNNYKTEQCKDDLETSNCPRGVYCAFKHASEIVTPKVPSNEETADGVGSEILKVEEGDDKTLAEKSFANSKNEVIDKDSLEKQLANEKTRSTRLQEKLAELTAKLSIYERLSECPICLCTKVDSICCAMPCGHITCKQCVLSLPQTPGSTDVGAATADETPALAIDPKSEEPPILNEAVKIGNVADTMENNGSIVNDDNSDKGEKGSECPVCGVGFDPKDIRYVFM